MHAALLVMVGVSLGVDVGWQSLEDGGVEYIIQLDPQALEQLRSGEELRSDLPPFVREQMRSYRIKVGDGELPRDMNIAPPAGAASTDDPPRESESDAQGDPARVADSARGTEFPEAPPSGVRPPRNEPRYPAVTPLEQRSMPAPGDADVAASQPPRIIEPDPASTALVNHESGYREGAEAGSAAGPSAKTSGTGAAVKTSEATPGRWWPLTGALLTLFVSMGGNAYLGMQWWTARQRCQELLRQLRSPRHAAPAISTNADADDEDQDVQIVSDRRRR